MARMQAPDDNQEEVSRIRGGGTARAGAMDGAAGGHNPGSRRAYTTAVTTTITTARLRRPMSAQAPRAASGQRRRGRSLREGRHDAHAHAHGHAQAHPSRSAEVQAGECGEDHADVGRVAIDVKRGLVVAPVEEAPTPGRGRSRIGATCLRNSAQARASSPRGRGCRPATSTRRSRRPVASTKATRRAPRERGRDARLLKADEVRSPFAHRPCVVHEQDRAHARR
jgi:hypothetical protein